MDPPPTGDCGARAAAAPARYRALARSVCGELSSADLPGASVAVVEDGELRFEFAAGARCLDSGEALASGDAMRFGSATKLLTGSLALRFAAAGRIELDGAVPEIGEGPRPTFRQLADHRSGLRDPPPAELYSGDPGAYREALAAQADATPGAYQYSNLGFALLGEALGAAGGGGYASGLRSQVLEPAGLDGTRLSGADLDREAAACGHARGSAGLVQYRVPDDFEQLAGGADWALPAGGAVGPARDLARAALFRARLDGGPGAPTGRDRETYAAGAFVSTLSDGRTLVRHAGNTLDFAVDVFAIPEDGFALALMSNGPAHLRTTSLVALEQLAALPRADRALTIPADAVAQSR